MPNCIHCGEKCGPVPVVWEDKYFCCNGCKAVYQILNESKLYRYYELDQSPGIKIEDSGHKGRFDYLDEEAIQAQLLDYDDNNTAGINLYIPAIHCSSCIWLLENLQRLHHGIIHSQVNFTRKEVFISFDKTKISLRQVAELLASIHYIPLITLEKTANNKSGQGKSNRYLLYKVGVAGFAFGNIMLFSFPNYLSKGYVSDKSFFDVFAWLSLILSIPVVFYSGNDYIISAFKSLRKKVININLPIAIGIISLFLQSAYEIITSSGAGYCDSLTGLIFFLLIGRWYQEKTYQALSFERDYKSYFPVAVSKKNEAGEQYTLLSELKAGDRILIRNMELIPADSRLIAGDAFIDNSFITGESKPVVKKVGEVVFAGGRQVGSAIELEIFREVNQSRLTELWNRETEAKNHEKSLSVLTDTVSKYFTIAIILISLSTFIYWLFTNPEVALRASTAVLIVACPCALALSLPFALGNMMRLFGKEGFYLKNSAVVEKLNRFDTIVFDKTGTLTHPKSYLVKIINHDFREEDRLLVKSLAKHSIHPYSKAVYKHFFDTGELEVENFREIPALGTVATINGKTVKLGSEEFITGIANGDSSTSVFASVDGRLSMSFQFDSGYRQGMEQILRKLAEKYELHLLSGDNDSEKQRLLPFFTDENHMRFNCNPLEKLDYIKSLHSKGKRVLMIGDGLNDAGALKESDVSITIADDAYYFSPACDAILESTRFEKLLKFIRLSSTALNVVKAGFVVSILYNTIGIGIAVQGLLSPVIAAMLMPASSVTAVAFVTLLTSLFFKRNFPSGSV